MKGLVIEKQSDKFLVDCEGEVLTLFSRGKNKQQGVFVGDFVQLDKIQQTIEWVMPRQNLLVRPNLANVSKLFIVIAPVPKPDFAIVDKLALFCFVHQIEPIIIVNKTDICNQDFCDNITNIYQNVCKIYFVSAKSASNLQALHAEFSGNICALAGQSAVGKSALICALYPESKAIVGQLSQKIMRGKNTTRSAKLYKLEQNTYLADTPGFSSLDILYLPIKYFELCYFYPDFLIYHQKCKYKSCTHTKESLAECGVKQAVESGKIDLERYNRYVEMFDILQRDWILNGGTKKNNVR